VPLVRDLERAVPSFPGERFRIRRSKSFVLLLAHVRLYSWLLPLTRLLPISGRPTLVYSKQTFQKGKKETTVPNGQSESSRFLLLKREGIENERTIRTVPITSIYSNSLVSFFLRLVMPSMNSD
jgi:hypothetical protein